MRINTVNNNVNFGKLHIYPTKANRIALGKFLDKSPEVLKEALADLDRESGEDHIFIKTGYDYNMGDIPIAIAKRGDNILTVRRINVKDETEMNNGFKNLIESYVKTTMKKDPSKPKPNEDVKAILDQYA